MPGESSSTRTVARWPVVSLAENLGSASCYMTGVAITPLGSMKPRRTPPGSVGDVSRPKLIRLQVYAVSQDSSRENEGAQRLS